MQKKDEAAAASSILILPLGIVVSKEDTCAAHDDVLAPLSTIVFSDKVEQYTFLFHLNYISEKQDAAVIIKTEVFGAPAFLETIR